MQILEQQALYLYDLLSCRIQMPRARLPEMLPRIPEQLGALGLQQNGRILFTEDPAQERNIEILIPVRGEFASCAQYEKKPVFKLINAVSARHEGSFSALAKTEQQLLQYAQEKAYQVITEVYYSIVRMDAGNPENCIIDLYIGVNYNIL